MIFESKNEHDSILGLLNKFGYSETVVVYAKLLARFCSLLCINAKCLNLSKEEIMFFVLHVKL